MTMKKSAKLKFLSLATLVFAGVFGGAAGTVAWFTTNVHIEEANMLLTGDALGAYFEYGDGTESKPYGIKTVRQLYNLSWLQYLGYFNPTKVNDYPYSGRWVDAMKKIYGNDFNQKPHFELAGNIDWSNKDASSIGINGIPPIGTTTFPFQGFFNGRGYTISNGVFSTNSSDFGIKPLAVDTYTADTNVGVFGKVTGAATSIKDVGISSPLVKSTLANTVIGAAVGDAGAAQYSNIAVDDPTLRIGNGTSASNLSDYGLVGKIDSSNTHQMQIVDNRLSTIDVTQDTFTVPNQGGENDWGGSLNMVAMFNRLNTIYNDYSSKPAGSNTDPYIPLRRTHNYGANGAERSYTTNYTATYNSDSDSPGLKRYNNIGRKSGVSYKQEWGAYQMTRRYDPTSSSSSFMYLSGGHWAVNQSLLHSGYRITDGTNYLQFNTSGTNNLSNKTTDISNATVWQMPANGQSGTISTVYNGTTYYLYDDNGTIKAGSTQTTWTIEDDNGDRYIYNENRQLYYSSGWKLGTRPAKMYATKDGVDYYLSISSEKHPSYDAYAWATETDPENAVDWYYDGTNFYTIKDSKTYYMISSTYVISDSGYAKYQYDGNTKYVYASYTENYYRRYGYVILDGSNNFAAHQGLTSPSHPSDAVEIELDKWLDSSYVTNVTSYLANQETTDIGTITQAGMFYGDQDVTYYPLGAKESANDTNATHDEGLYDALYQNTGYVIGGSSLTQSTTSFSTDYSTVRVSKYYNGSSTYSTYLKNFNGTTLSSVKTIDSSGTYTAINDASNNLVKYQKSKEDFVKILKNSGGALYGLHFMQADIDMSNLVTAKYARINGEVFSNYQMPANSIDFKLKQKGYVNFFAGSYMGGGTADSFFSLHMIERDPENQSIITSIDEIEEIYSDYDEDNIATESHSYIYRIKDKENSTAQTTIWIYTRPFRVNSRGERLEIEKNQQGQDVAYQGGTLTQTEFDALTNYYSVFNTSRIKYQAGIKNNQSYCFYYEIPINAGEYCLGSVSNGEVGGYLLYLDIGANAQKDNRTEIHEKFVRAVSLTSYAENFILVESASAVMATLITTVDGERVKTGTDLDAADSIAFRVKAGQAGDVVLERDSNVITLSRSGPPDTAIIYANRALTLREQTGESSYTPVSVVKENTTTTTFNRLTILDWDASNAVGTVTTITDTTSGNNTTRTIVQTKGGESVATPVVYKGTDWDAACGTAFTAQELAALDITYSPASTICEFDYVADAASTIATDFALQGDLDDERGFYTLDGYDFDITRTGTTNFTAYVTKTTSSITIVVEDSDDLQYTFVYKINGNTVSAPTTVLINRAPTNP